MVPFPIVFGISVAEIREGDPGIRKPGRRFPSILNPEGKAEAPCFGGAPEVTEAGGQSPFPRA